MKLAFDRGTILVHDPPEHVDASSLPGVLWDPRVRAFRAPARCHPAIHAEVLARGIELEDSARSKLAPSQSWTAPELRPYQEAAIASWELAGHRGIVVLPTGSGKTRVALSTIARRGLTALCLVPTRVLLEQWLREIGAIYAGQVGRFGDGARDLAPVTVATFESAYRHMHEIGRHFDLLVVDEAHHFGAGLRDEALEMSIARERLGLTATPPGGAALARLTDLLGPVVFQLAVGDLAGTFLSSFDIVTIRLALIAREREEYDRLTTLYRPVVARFMRERPGADWLEFVRIAKQSREGWRALRAWRSARDLLSFTTAKRRALGKLLAEHRSSRVLLFTADNESAYAIAREHLIMPITCDIGRQERAAALDRFARGELRALVSARVLNEGLDVPDADVAIVVGASLGQREHVQRIGRLLRPREGKRALVYELVTLDTAEEQQARRRRQGIESRVGAQL